MNSQDAPRHFRCPNLECGLEYFASAKDEAPATKPACIECGTPFLAKDRGRYIHYSLARLD
jgi:hypothetical protein